MHHPFYYREISTDTGLKVLDTYIIQCSVPCNPNIYLNYNDQSTEILSNRTLKVHLGYISVIRNFHLLLRLLSQSPLHRHLRLQPHYTNDRNFSLPLVFGFLPPSEIFDLLRFFFSRRCLRDHFLRGDRGGLFLCQFGWETKIRINLDKVRRVEGLIHYFSNITKFCLTIKQLSSLSFPYVDKQYLVNFTFILKIYGKVFLKKLKSPISLSLF